MLIIAGKLYVDAEKRDEFADSYAGLVKRARAQPGCIDFVISADPLEAGRVNMMEQWESEEHLAAWRAMSDPPLPVTRITAEDVHKHQVASSGPPF